MLLVLTLLSSALALPQSADIDQSVLLEIFGRPPDPDRGQASIIGATSTSTVSTKLEDQTIRPTDSSSKFTDANGAECQCVPYYLCDANLVGVDANNESVTGWGTLDIRFKEDECQESVERCCTHPNTDEVVPPTPRPPVPKGCGYRNKLGLDFTITGGSGSEAQFGEFPWVVALLDPRNGSYLGVGSLIHPAVVLTTAHVVMNYRHAPAEITVRAGEWDTQTTKERLKYEERQVAEIYSHNEFHPKSLRNDMALLRLASPLPLADHISTLCLPSQNENFETSRNCVANGWGKTVFGQEGRYAVILKRIEVDMVPHALCNAQLQRTRLGQRFRLHSSFVCAGGEEGKDTCQGDGGAPLACPIGNDRYKLTGLVAWGIGCGQKDVPAVYAAAAIFRNWVDNKMAAWGYDSTSYTV